MIRNWRWPIVAGLLVAALAYVVTLRRAPTMLMAAAERRLEKLGGVNRFAHAPLAFRALRLPHRSGLILRRGADDAAHLVQM